ncbi:phage tail protein [Paracoccus aerius]|uniref:Phage tail protein n=2 Tax=Paracoccus aerius TaxID=1915382 RepID=A0ABS1S0M6_9RHOB|nr:phage tail protein [Paracoccus aerius]MBL3672256.1 phage tail protein [Paracoccus aerius]GHG11314.1 hypothetical protein GCM10017322_03520 [Paracoccus aerius]
MAGPVVMSLGFFQFTARGFSFDGRCRDQDTSWVSTPVAGGFDRLQWTGGRGRTETISGALFDEFGGDWSLEGIKLAAKQGQPLTLVSLGGAPFNAFGIFVVERISEDHGFIDQNGRPMKNAYTIDLRGYEGEMNLMSAAVGTVLQLL